MGAAAARKVDSQTVQQSDLSNPLLPSGPAYESSFLDALEPAIEDIAKHGIKVIVNAGASDTAGLFARVCNMIDEKGLNIKVAWVSGDEVLGAVHAGLKSLIPFKSLYTGQTLTEWDFEPIYAQAYLGGFGIATALSKGAQIVLCGRVSDASPVIGAAVWYHDWQRSQLHELANSLVAGHLIECGSYICGGNFAGFKALEAKGWTDLGFPIAEISKDGSVVITMQKHTPGTVTRHTCSAQLLYEIQGPWYYNSDVTAVLDQIYFEEVGQDRVALRGVQALPPPPTTKCGITAKGGFQAETCYFLTGLDIDSKARMLEAQLRKILSPYSSNYSHLSFSTIGTAAIDADSQNAATVIFRVFVQAKSYDAIQPPKFLRPIMDCIMQGYPGATFHLDYRQGIPKPYFEYYVTLLPQSEIHHAVHIGSETIAIPSPPKTMTFPERQPSQSATSNPESGHMSYGPTTRAPLGSIVYARSGDKGGDCNCGFWVRSEDEYLWLKGLLSSTMLQQLLGKEYNATRVPKIEIERFELPRLRAVHFLIRNILDRGVQSTSGVDFLGKNCAEFLRNRLVDIPTAFLERGTV